ncbi:hypothetical protein [Staphylospora marina]|uniref:hypothetical protein n=1 Tax=Staphylospora marina TaxID=2490858 RepID=UPI000F5B8D54|nr:hypothetical protein [Staphylospora marina]
MNIFEKFVAENVDGGQRSKREHVVLLPGELSQAFEHWCRKRNLSFSQGVAELIREALEKEKKRDKDKKEPALPDASKFMRDAF